MNNLTNDEAIFRQGSAYFYSGRLYNAEKCYESLIQDYPDSKFYGLAHGCLGEVYWEYSNPPLNRAISCMETALERLSPSNITDDQKASSYRVIGVFCLRQSFECSGKDQLDKLRKAYDTLTKYLSLKDDWRVREDLVYICEKLGKAEEAGRHHQAYLELVRE